MKRITHTDELITTYLSGEPTSAELEELKAWVDASPENRKHFLNIQEVWFSSVGGADGKRFDKDAAYKRFLNKTAGKRRRFLGRVLRPVIGVAAAAALAGIVWLFAYRQGGDQIRSLFSNIVIEAPLGSRTKLYLPDSTLVWLNAGSRITYSQGFAVSERKIHLSGEGYFEVARNEKLPMQIITDEVRVEVLGTVLNFRNYPDEEEVVVSLEKGRIVSQNMLATNQQFTLAPNQKATLNKKTRMMRVSEVPARNVSGWIDGSLFFDERLLPDIIRTLERSYNVNIRMADESMNNFRFYGQFSRTENTIKDVLDRLKATNRLEYLVNGSEIVLIPKN